MDLRWLKILAISDLCITESMYRETFAALTARGAKLDVIEWRVRDLNDLRAKVDKTEREGAESVPPPPELESSVSGVDVLVMHLSPVPERVIAGAAGLKLIGCARSGWENVAATAATARNIPILYCPLSKVSTAADAAIGMILSECRGLARAHCQLVQGIWDTTFAFFGNSMSLTGNTVGLVGFGNIGKAVAQRLRGFEADILVYDPFQPPEAIRDLGCTPVGLDELLARSDFVVMMARMSEDTRGMIGRREFELMKPDAYFVNTARGGLVDYGALREVLAQRRIAGAALDVFDVEPIAPDDPLLKLDNVSLSPHVAGVSREGYRRSAQDVAQDIATLLAGGTPRFVVNPQTLRNMTWPPRTT